MFFFLYFLLRPEKNGKMCSWLRPWSIMVVWCSMGSLHQVRSSHGQIQRKPAKRSAASLMKMNSLKRPVTLHSVMLHLEPRELLGLPRNHTGPQISWMGDGQEAGRKERSSSRRELYRSILRVEMDTHRTQGLVTWRKKVTTVVKS